jgi:outer membrane receptor protein involved in Fe transport
MRIDRVRADDVETKHRWVGNLFSQQEIRILEGRVRIFPALGVEFADTSSGKARIPGPDLYQEVDVDDDPAWLPSIGGIVELAPGLRMKSNYRRAYRRPNFSELFHPDYTFVRGNPELDAEESWDFDIGLEFADEGWGPLEDLRLEGVFFHRDIEESIEWVQAYRSVEPHNTGGARARGYELSGGLLLWDRLDLTGTYTFTSTKIRDSGNPLPHSPRNQIFGRATLRLGRSSVWAELSYEDEHFLNEGGQRRADAVTQIDLGITVRLVDLPGLLWVPERLSISAECINLTEEVRVDALGLPLPDDRLWYLRLRLASR